jgi:hypothetical protein
LVHPGGGFREEQCTGVSKVNFICVQRKKIKEPKSDPFPHGVSPSAALMAKRVP